MQIIFQQLLRFFLGVIFILNVKVVSYGAQFKPDPPTLRAQVRVMSALHAKQHSVRIMQTNHFKVNSLANKMVIIMKYKISLHQDANQIFYDILNVVKYCGTAEYINNSENKR